MQKKILVIGSNSFSGSDFIDLLIEKGKYEVAGISRTAEKSELFLPYKRHKNARFHFYQLDLNKDTDKIIKLLDKLRPKAIVNFAALSEVAPSWEYPEQWFETNVVALVRLCKYLKDVTYLKKYIQISTPEVYGTCKGKIKEDAPFCPSTPYAASKASADLFLSTLVKNFHFPLVTIRSTNVYGAHQQLYKIIPRSVISMKLGKVIPLHGAGKAVKSYIHIRDVSEGELLALEIGRPGQIYHLSSSDAASVREIVRIICRKMKVSFGKATREAGERLGQDKAYIIDSGKAKRELGWKSVISISYGIDEVIKWVEDNWDKIKHLPLEYIHKA